ncbi:MAG: peptide deformylase [Candidatus Omnitrophica bacterium]|nr:peptide deformylase [Candidatus Omnitrophota bacterium]
MIRVIGDPVLRTKAKELKTIEPEHIKLLSQMAQTMYAAKGIGLAAPQVGVNLRLIVVDCGSGLYKLINPVIIKRFGRQKVEEGCLSVPGCYVKVKRAKKIILKAQDEQGKLQTIEAEDLLACVFQHEIDHLDGKLILDYAPFWRKISLRKKLREISDERMSKQTTKPKAL